MLRLNNIFLTELRNLQLIKTLRQPLYFLQLFRMYLVGKKSNYFQKSLLSLIDFYSFNKIVQSSNVAAVILVQVVVIFCFCVTSVF